MSRLTTVYIPSVLIGFLLAAGAAAIGVVEVLYLRLSLGAGIAMIGSLLGAAAIPALVFMPYLRSISERMSQHQFLTWTALLLACGAVAAALLGNAGLYLAPKLLFIMLLPLAAPSIITLLDDVFHFARNKESLLIFFTATATIGAATGALAAGFIARYNLANAYLLAAACFGLSALIASLLPRNARARFRGDVSLDPLPRLTRALSEPLLPFAIIVFIVQGYWSLRDFALPMFLLSHDLSAMAVGIVFAITSIGAVIGIFVARRLLSKNPSPAVITATLLVMGVAGMVLPLGPFLFVILGAFAYGAAESGLSPGVTDEATRGASLREGPEILVSLATVGTLAWIVVPIVTGILAEAGVPFGFLLFVGGAAVIGAHAFARNRWDFERSVPKMSWKRKRRLF